MKSVDIVFDGPPGPEAGRFVEVESPPGTGINFGEWLQRDDGYWVLRIPAVMRWISVDVALPEIHEDVLVWVIFHRRTEGTGETSWLQASEEDRPAPNWAMGSAEGYQVTHWARITDPRTRED